jgi:hypothetical protein
VSDGLLTDTGTVTVTVNPVNDAPTITVPSDVYTIDEDTTAVITFTVADVDTPLSSLSVSAAASDPNLMASSSSDIDDATGIATTTITPRQDAYGTGVITLTVSDGALTASDVFTLTVVEVNDPPTASDDTATVAEDSVGNQIFVLLNDSTAPDVGETKSVQAVGPAANGEAGVSTSDIVTYTPDADFVGTDTFTYTMSDGRGLTATATVSVTVTPEPEAPSINVPGDAYATDEDVSKSIDFVVGDGDTPLGDLIFAAEVLDTALIPLDNVTFSGTGANRTATITPAVDVYGSTVITFTVSDGALSDRDAFTLTVAPVNDPPSFDSAPIELAVVDEPYTYTISAVDPDEGDVLEIRAPKIPSWLTLVDNGDGTATLSGTPTSAQVGDHSVELRVLDDDSLDDTQTFTITVEPTIYRVYLPVVARNHVVAPDLVVESLVATSNGVTVTIKNVGNAPIEDLFANEFWVDVYVDPDTPPTAVNQTWEVVGDEGLAWGITVDALPLAPGDALTLTAGGPYLRLDESDVTWPLASGAPVYAQVDSAHVETAHGTVWETHELINGIYNNISGPVTVSSVQGGTAPVPEAYRLSPDSHLPPRP